MDWWAELDWSKRPPEFGEVVRYDGVPAMAFRPRRPGEFWDRVCSQWGRVARTPSLLEPLSTAGNDGTIILRYAPLTWSQRSVPDAVIVHWAPQVESTFRAIEMVTPPTERWLFSRPDVHIDAGSGIRIGFLPPEGGERELDLDVVVHGVIRELSEGIQNRELAGRLRERYAPGPRQAVLYDQFSSTVERSGILKAAWERLDYAIGFLLFGDHAAALSGFEDADFIVASDLTRWGINECRRALDMPLVDTPPPRKEAVVKRVERVQPIRWWSDAERDVSRLEAERDFKGALRLYDTLGRNAEQHGVVLARRARCHLELHETGYAIDYAQRALALEPTRIEAHNTLVRAWLEHRDPARALVAADAFVRIATHDAAAHYLRGKALLVLGRHDEARDEFDLAITFKPTMLEAILLRSEVHRNLVKLGKVVGSQRVSLTLPDHLEHLREILASGRSKNIIEALSAPSLETDAEAQLMLARFLGFADRHDEAIAIYDRWLDSAHRITALIGKAGALLDTGRIESALALFDSAIAEAPNHLDACEGRARTLDTLGRTGEAAAEFRRFISLGAQRAEIRVRAAQLWLDAH